MEVTLKLIKLLKSPLSCTGSHKPSLPLMKLIAYVLNPDLYSMAVKCVIQTKWPLAKEPRLKIIKSEVFRLQIDPN